MSRIYFRLCFGLSLALVSSAIVLIGWCEHFPKLSNLITGLRETKECVIVLAGAVIADVFARRNTFSTEVRQLSNDCNEAVQDAIKYTHIEAPRHEDWLDAKRAVSTATDEVRNTFANVGGLYPFENLKSIGFIIEALNPKEFDRPQWAAARSCVIQLWRQMRPELRNERPILSGSRKLTELLERLRRDPHNVSLLVVLDRLR